LGWGRILAARLRFFDFEYGVWAGSVRIWIVFVRKLLDLSIYRRCDLDDLIFLLLAYRGIVNCH
jgi:hypothetical protein